METYTYLIRGGTAGRRRRAQGRSSIRDIPDQNAEDKTIKNKEK